LAGGFTLIVAAGVVTSLAAGSIGTALISGFVAVLVGRNVYVLSEKLPSTIVDTKQIIQIHKGLKEGVSSTTTTSHVIMVPEFNEFEVYLNQWLPK
jgi:hypothetical protein